MPTFLRLAGFSLFLIVGVLLPASASAWNTAGHRLVAVIAWQEMSADQRASVAALLEAHPDAARWARKIRPGEDRALVLFSEASTWADDIRHDARFYDEGREAETALLPGFPDMARRRSWHFLNLPIGAASERGAGEVDRRILRLGDILGDRRATDSNRAYALVWLIHLVADLHQPLHVATRHDDRGNDDGGGNGVPIFDPGNPRHPHTNLHAWWDDLPGPPWLRGARLAAAADALRQAHPPPTARPGTAADPALWRDESYRLAKTVVYAPVASAPVTIDADYRRQARRIADERIALAGYRLAHLLGELLAAPSAHR